jgi:hypothetical protein
LVTKKRSVAKTTLTAINLKGCYRVLAIDRELLKVSLATNDKSLKLNCSVVPPVLIKLTCTNLCVPSVSSRCVDL